MILQLEPSFFFQMDTLLKIIGHFFLLHLFYSENSKWGMRKHSLKLKSPPFQLGCQNRWKNKKKSSSTRRKCFHKKTSQIIPSSSSMPIYLSSQYSGVITNNSTIKYHQYFFLFKIGLGIVLSLLILSNSFAICAQVLIPN